MQERRLICTFTPPSPLLHKITVHEIPHKIISCTQFHARGPCTEARN